MDDDGYLYFVGRMDEMIKTSGYRVSPSEIEEIAYGTGLVAEVAAIGLPDKKLGQAIGLVAKPTEPKNARTEDLVNEFRRQAPNYMVPTKVIWMPSLPRNSNGKLDRVEIARHAAEFVDRKTHE
jgi:acyl-coenzyme A synthetase/AMP-(fatty) acid ligase